MMKDNDKPSKTVAVTLRGMPLSAKDKFLKLKRDGVMYGSFSAFIINATLEKLSSVGDDN